MARVLLRKNSASPVMFACGVGSPSASGRTGVGLKSQNLLKVITICQGENKTKQRKSKQASIMLAPQMAIQFKVVFPATMGKRGV